MNYDHHCPWIGKCIGYNNRYLFIFFLVFLPLWAIFITVMSILLHKKPFSGYRPIFGLRLDFDIFRWVWGVVNAIVIVPTLNLLYE